MKQIKAFSGRTIWSGRLMSILRPLDAIFERKICDRVENDLELLYNRKWSSYAIKTLSYAQFSLFFDNGELSRRQW